MNNQVIEKVNALREGVLTKEQIQTLAQAGIIPHDTPPAQVQAFAAACTAHGLSPFRKEIYLTKYNTKAGPVYSTIVGIDGLRKKAARTGDFAGRDDAKFNAKSDGSYMGALEASEAGKAPKSCSVTVYRVTQGHRVSFTKTVLWNEYAPASPPPSSKWVSMPFNMLEKCAEAAALRMAFADETAGLHIAEEREAFQDTTVQAAAARPEVMIDADVLAEQVNACETIDDLQALYKANPLHVNFADLFTARKNAMQ